MCIRDRTENPRVDGSIPSGGTKNADVAHLVERHLAKVEVASSSLVGRSILWKFSSAGRASALQAEGQRFDPVNSHRSRSVAVITSPCHGEDRGFDSRRDR